MTPQQGHPVTHIIVGTKAQFIKMAPIATLLEREGWPYRILDLGQHGSITPGILRDFRLTPDQAHVLPGGSTVSTYRQALSWLRALTARILSPRQKLKDTLLKHPAGYALVHGDTLSTLFGLYLAKRLGVPIGLVEAGLSSGRLFDPFPEEMIRRHVERRVDFLFAPDQDAADRLTCRGLSGVVVNTNYNTGRDALLMISELHTNVIDSKPGFKTVLTLHRAETISNKIRLRAVIEHVMALAPRIGPIRFYLHEPTKRALVRAGLMGRLEGSSYFELYPLGTYPEFTAALVSAQYILTDGGSVQEEASYLRKPCLILRRSTERQHGLQSTAMLSSMTLETDIEFLSSQAQCKSQASETKPLLSAARIILDSLYRGRLEPEASHSTRT